MKTKISKEDVKDIIAQSKEIIKTMQFNLKTCKEAERKANINIVTATAIIKHLGGK